MKKMLSGARLDISISKNKRLQEVFIGMIGVASLFFVLFRFFSESVNTSWASGFSSN